MALTGATGYDLLSGAGYPSATVTDFTLYVQATMSPAWQSAFTAAGADTGTIRVTDALGTELPRDILSYSSGVLAMRVLWSGARGVGDYPTLRVYPDATGSYAVTDTYGGYAAYGSGWLGYWTLDEDPTGSAPQFINRVANANHGTAQGAIAAGASVAGKLGRGIVGDGSSDCIDCGSFKAQLGGATAATMMAWCKRTGATGVSGRCIFGFGGTYSKRFVIYVWEDGNIYFSIDTGIASYPSVTASGTEWMHVAADYDGNRAPLSRPGAHLNGSPVALSPGGADPAAALSADMSNLFINRLSGGILDDVQLHSVARGSAWIAYEYEITSAPSTFWTDSGWTSLATGSSIAAIAAYYRRMRA